MANIIKHIDAQIAEIETNLLLIAEQKYQYVQQETIPLDLIKNERRLQAELDELRARRERIRSGTNPYRGMEPFDRQHVANYFGRDAMTAKLVNRLHSSNFVAVVGASGSGKSSLVRAGLAKALSSDTLPDSHTWPVMVVRPQADPAFALASAITALLSPNETDDLERAKKVRNWADSILAGPRQLLDALTLWRQQQPDRSRAILIIDQFEEFNTFRNASEAAIPDNHSAFIAALVELHTLAWFLQIVTVRADFAGNLLETPRIGALADDGWLNILPMTEEEQRAAIEEPALGSGCQLEDGLTNRVIADLAKQPGQLPLLEFALTDLWDRQDSRGYLTHAAYNEIGGVTGAIANYAEERYTELPPPRQTLAPELFLLLVDVIPLDDGAQYLRQRVYLDELRPELRSLAEHLSTYRLLVTDRDLTGRNTAEIVHEALIREWRRLRDWLDENQAALLFRQRIDEAMHHWQPDAPGRDADVLLRGRFLDDALEWQKHHPSLVTQRHAQYITASKVQRQREVKKARRQAQRLAFLLGMLVLLLVPGVFVGANAVMLYLRRSSNWQPTEFVANSVLAIAQTAQHDDEPARICVATADIGIGCSHDLLTWNVYQIGLPRGTTGTFTDRNSIEGALTGSTWATRVRAVEALAIDSIDPMNLLAAVFIERAAASAGGTSEARLYTSSDGGVHWQALNATGLPADAEVREVALAGDTALALLKSETRAMTANQRGSLYVTTDGGRSWRQIAGADFATGVVRDIDVRHSTDGMITTLYAAGNMGLFQSQERDFAAWEQLLPGEDQSLGLLVDASSETIYYGTYLRTTDQGALHRWLGAGNLDNGKWIEFPNAPRSLAVQRVAGDDKLVWMLFDDGTVKAVDHSGALRDGDSRPGWPWSTAKTLALWHDVTDQAMLLMGHRDGLLQLCPERLPQECLSQ